jgi:hypothetical protein
MSIAGRYEERDCGTPGSDMSGPEHGVLMGSTEPGWIVSPTAAPDPGLLNVVTRCEGRTAIQLQWLPTRMKQTAPQALVVAS